MYFLKAKINSPSSSIQTRPTIRIVEVNTKKELWILELENNVAHIINAKGFGKVITTPVKKGETIILLSFLDVSDFKKNALI